MIEKTLTAAELKKREEELKQREEEELKKQEDIQRIKNLLK